MSRTASSEDKSYQAFSLLEDFSPFKMSDWTLPRMNGTMIVNRATAYSMVTNLNVVNCPHCVGVTLYCQYRGFACVQEDFQTGGDQNPLFMSTVKAAEGGSKVANLVAGMVLRDRKDTRLAVIYFGKCLDIPLACLMKGAIHYAAREFESAG